MLLPRFAWLALVVVAASAARAQEPADFTVYVSNERSGDVTVIDGATRTVRAEWPVGKRPRGIHMSPSGDTLYVAVSGSPIMGPGAHEERSKSETPDRAADGIVVVDPQTGHAGRKIDVGSDPEQFAVTPDGKRVIVSNEDDAAASCWNIDSGDRVFATRVSEEPEGVAVNPLGNEVYVTCEQRGDVFVLDLPTGHPIATLHVHGRPRSVAFLPDGTHAYVPAEGDSVVTLVDARAHTVLETIKIPGEDVLPMCAVASPDGKHVYVSTGRGNSVAVLDTAKNTIETVIKVGARPWGIALSPDGKTLFAANGRSDDVSVVDLAANKEIGRIKAGRGPWGIAVATNARR